MSNRTYRIAFMSKYAAHHCRPDWDGKRRGKRSWHSVEFRDKRSADRFLRLVRLLARAGIVGGYITAEIIH